MTLDEKTGVPIVGTWMNTLQNEFIWVRNYKDKTGWKRGTKSSKPLSPPLESNWAAASQDGSCQLPASRSRFTHAPRLPSGLQSPRSVKCALTSVLS